jgi:hypothetical protein
VATVARPIRRAAILASNGSTMAGLVTGGRPPSHLTKMNFHLDAQDAVLHGAPSPSFRTLSQVAPPASLKIALGPVNQLKYLSKDAAYIASAHRACRSPRALDHSGGRADRGGRHRWRGFSRSEKLRPRQSGRRSRPRSRSLPQNASSKLTAPGVLEPGEFASRHVRQGAMTAGRVTFTSRSSR